MEITFIIAANGYPQTPNDAGFRKGSFVIGDVTEQRTPLSTPPDAIAARRQFWIDVPDAPDDINAFEDPITRGQQAKLERMIAMMEEDPTRTRFWVDLAAMPQATKDVLQLTGKDTMTWAEFEPFLTDRLDI